MNAELAKLNSSAADLLAGLRAASRSVLNLVLFGTYVGLILGGWFLGR